MIRRMVVPMSGAVADVVRAPSRRREGRKTRLFGGDAGRWEWVWIGFILLIAGLVHGINMFDYPYFHDDEGIYVSEAWAVTKGHLSNYTYIYDHAPLGWMQIALWALTTGGFQSLGLSVDSGRVLMMVLQVASTLVVYLIGRRISGSVWVASVASLLFSLSVYGIYWHRRVTLDSVSVFWMLLSIVLLLSPRLSLSRVWLSALALSFSILSKEQTVFLIPILAYLAFYKAHPSQRLFAFVGWVTVVVSTVSAYLLLAVLKGELFPTGTFLGGDRAHVSLIETLKWQASRGKDGGIFEAGSDFWSSAHLWAHDEPLLVLGGTACALVSVLVLKWWRLAGVMGLATLSLWAFVGRGGIVNDHFLLPLLPLLALNFALVLGMVADGSRWVLDLFLERPSGARATGRIVLPVLAVGACALFVWLELTTPQYGFGKPDSATQLWRGEQSQAQTQALDWVRANLPKDSTIIMDEVMWVDLQDPRDGGKPFKHADYYYKVDLDPQVKNGEFPDGWRDADYVITTPTLLIYSKLEHMQTVMDATEHSTPIKRFDTGGWPIEVLKVNKGAEEGAGPE